MNRPERRMDWAAWRVSEDEVRVQINRPDLAKAFAKIKSVRPAGYSVSGNYLKLFHVNQSVPWVDTWMKDYMVRGLAKTTEKGSELN